MLTGQVMQHVEQVAASDLATNWLIIVGIGCLWLGGQIVWVAPWPRQVRRWLGQAQVPVAKAGTSAAFGLFWIDQYGWIGLVLCALGATLAVAGAVL